MSRKKQPISSDFNWELTKEVYRFMWTFWDVCKAKQMIIDKPRKIVSMDCSSLKNQVQRPKEGVNNLGHTINWTKVDSGDLDLDFPLVGVTFEAGPWIIDGWHRMAKGFELDMTSFPVACLSRRETKLLQRTT